MNSRLHKHTGYFVEEKQTHFLQERHPITLESALLQRKDRTESEATQNQSRDDFKLRKADGFRKGMRSRSRNTQTGHLGMGWPEQGKLEF